MDHQEKKRRRREKILSVFLIIIIASLTALEVHILRLSATLPFVNSIFFFGLMNLNIVLIMLLLFLIFRNTVKLLLDQKRGRLGSRLKAKLVLLFILFAIIPTMLLFTISATYIKSSFDIWFSQRVGGTLQKSIDVVKQFYETTEAHANHFASRLEALSKNKNTAVEFEQLLIKAQAEYGVDAIEWYRDPFSNRKIFGLKDRENQIPVATLEALRFHFSGQRGCRVQHVGRGELIRCGVYLGSERGVLFVDYFIPLRLATQLSEIALTYEDFKKNNPLNYPVKSIYFGLLVMMTLLILFAAIWTGFHLAKRLTIPIEQLSRATSEVARGNLDYHIPSVGNDELERLVKSFNQMTQDLRLNKKQIEKSHTSLRKINEELQHRKHYIEILLESVQSAVISFDIEGQVSTLNFASEKLLGVRASEAIGKPFWALFPSEIQEELKTLVASLREKIKPVRREFRIKSLRKDWLTLVVTLSSLRGENEQTKGIVAVVDDVTEVQKMQRMSAWREVAKRIAHEIKNPLTPIQLCVERLRRRYLHQIQDDGTFHEATQMILQEVEALKNLVSEFSAFARLPEIKLTSQVLNDIILEAVNLFRSAHEKINFDLDLQEDLPPLDLDRSQLKRALINLFDNAVAAMNGEGEIHVVSEWEKNSGIIRLSVADSGCGIPENVMTQLFEPYFSTKNDGTGLGLAIVQRIIIDHGGQVRVFTHEPRGTKFVVELPEFSSGRWEGIREESALIKTSDSNGDCDQVDNKWL